MMQLHQVHQEFLLTAPGTVSTTGRVILPPAAPAIALETVSIPIDLRFKIIYCHHLLFFIKKGISKITKITEGNIAIAILLLKNLKANIRDTI
jgi:hypothetical protein